MLWWVLAFSLHLCPLSGALAAGDSEGRAGNSEPTHGAPGEQLQGVGTLAWPVRQEITCQLTADPLHFALFLTAYLKQPRARQLLKRIERAGGVSF